jgi:hypothetical protein
MTGFSEGTSVESPGAMSTPWLTDDEVDAMCDGLRQCAAKVKYLKSLGLAVKQKPNGRPLVLRSNVEEVLAGQPDKRKRTKPAERPPAQPDVAGLVLAYSRKS